MEYSHQKIYTVHIEARGGFCFMISTEKINTYTHRLNNLLLLSLLYLFNVQFFRINFFIQGKQFWTHLTHDIQTTGIMPCYSLIQGWVLQEELFFFATISNFYRSNKTIVGLQWKLFHWFWIWCKSWSG